MERPLHVTRPGTAERSLGRPRLTSQFLGCAALLVLALVVACGGAHREPPRTTPDHRASPSAERPDDEARDPESEPREISTDTADAEDTGAGTPEREASQQVVEEGKGYLITGRPSEAARRFERATRIDSTNGFAYYWLGRARIEAGDPGGAEGVLEKAETLLGPYPEWRERAALLLTSVR